ncbi:hypothetical protein AB0D49_13540 [Streptomyces sp. NPDC048290]|uniref:hypothetical protein n=1 Tax=Streptomyces sp. NPDC048290 TaxID=3155811 RepID=UPI00341F79CD
MLATLLPGVREIRLPLAVGYVWLLALWLAFGDRLPAAGTAHGVPGEIYRLARAAGPVAVGVAVSVGAYLLGVAAAPLGLSITYAVGQLLRRTPAAAVTPGSRSNERADRALAGLVTVRLAERVVDDGALRTLLLDRLEADPPSLSPARSRSQWQELLTTNSWARRWAVHYAVDVEKIADEFEADRSGLLWRLRGSTDPIAAEHDRLQAESDFRIAMFGPLCVTMVIVAIRWSPWALLALPLLLVLVHVGVGLRATAAEALAAALASGRIADPALERLAVRSVPLRPMPTPQTGNPPLA